MTTETLFDPDGLATVGGRGKDPALLAQIAEQRDAPPQHVIHGSRTVAWSEPQPVLSAREAWESRLKRLREAGTQHKADRDALTVTYSYELDDMTHTVHLRYTEPEEGA